MSAYNSGDPGLIPGLGKCAGEGIGYPLQYSWSSLVKKLGIKSPYDPAIPLLGIYPEETKNERDTCIPLFIAAVFTIARTWEQLRCPSTDEWIKK